ncbi:MAG: hypothetical protein ACRD8Z_08590, partial [Nitrososphaeraceae archaeon]
SVLGMLATTAVSSMLGKFVFTPIICTYWFRFLSQDVSNLQSPKMKYMPLQYIVNGISLCSPHGQLKLDISLLSYHELRKIYHRLRLNNSIISVKT